MMWTKLIQFVWKNKNNLKIYKPIAVLYSWKFERLVFSSIFTILFKSDWFPWPGHLAHSNKEIFTKKIYHPLKNQLFKRKDFSHPLVTTEFLPKEKISYTYPKENNQFSKRKEFLYLCKKNKFLKQEKNSYS